MDLNSPLELNAASIWQETRKRAYSFFCPLCTSPRHARMIPNPYRAILIFRVLLTAGFLALIASPWLAWKGVVVVFPLWVGFEMIYRMKARQDIECPHCGFDPYLYLSDREQANVRVKEHFRRRYEEAGVPLPEAAKVPPPNSRRSPSVRTAPKSRAREKAPEMSP